MVIDSVIKKIKSKGFKITKPREAILKTLVSSDKMLSCDNIYTYSKQICKNINLTTIYRNLETFVFLKSKCISELLESHSFF